MKPAIDRLWSATNLAAHVTGCIQSYDMQVAIALQLLSNKNYRAFARADS
jgi:hypothetical protein